MDAALVLGFLSALIASYEGWRPPVVSSGVGGLLVGGWITYGVTPVGYSDWSLLLSDTLFGFLMGLAFAIGDRYAVERRARR